MFSESRTAGVKNERLFVRKGNFCIQCTSCKFIWNEGTRRPCSRSCSEKTINLCNFCDMTVASGTYHNCDKRIERKGVL